MGGGLSVLVGGVIVDVVNYFVVVVSFQLSLFQFFGLV